MRNEKYDSEITIYISEIYTWKADRLRRLQNLIQNSDKRRFDKYLRLRFDKQKNQCLTGGALLNCALIQTGIKPEKGFTVDVDAYGKPHIQGIHHNLSYAGNLVFCGVSSGKLGIDAQVLEDYEADLFLELFSMEERKSLMGREHVEKAYEAAKLWTRKEGYVKYVGTGFGRNPSETGSQTCSVQMESGVFRDTVWSACYGGGLRSIKLDYINGEQLYASI